MTNNPATHPLRCSSKTKAGEPCKGYAVEGESTCVAHTPHIADLARSKGVERSREVRKERVEQRQQASEDAKLSLTARIRRAAADSQEDLVQSLVKAAISDGNGAAMRELLNRVEGKVVDVSRQEGGEALEAFTTEQLQAWLHTPITERTTVAEPFVSTDEQANGHTDRPKTEPDSVV